MNVKSVKTMNYEQLTMNNANKNKPNLSLPKGEQTQFQSKLVDADGSAFAQLSAFLFGGLGLFCVFEWLGVVLGLDKNSLRAYFIAV